MFSFAFSFHWRVAAWSILDFDNTNGEGAQAY